MDYNASVIVGIVSIVLSSVTTALASYFGVRSVVKRQSIITEAIAAERKKLAQQRFAKEQESKESLYVSAGHC